MTVTERLTCRACADPRLGSVLDLGNLAVSDFVDDPGAPLDRAPLELVRCEACGLVQLRHTVERDRLYRRYHYRSGVNETMVQALRDVVEDARARVDLQPGDWVLDVGANDGTLLDQYPAGINLIGFEPSQLASEAVRHSAQRRAIVRDYFPPARFPVDPVPCKVVTAIACFYDLDDPGAFLEEAKRWLHPEGVLVLQFQDAEAMVRANAVDNACHEHLAFYTLETLMNLAVRHGLRLVSAADPPINGGSLRVVLGHGLGPTRWISPPVDWAAFAERVKRGRIKTQDLLHRLWKQKKRVYGIGASTKFNTLSQYYGLGPQHITAIGERSPAKVGKYTVTGIPICSEEAMRAARPDYLFCGAWQFADAFLRRESLLLKHGCQFIVPLPELRVIGGEEMALAGRNAPAA